MKTEEKFLALLRAALWQTPCPEEAFPTDLTEWKEVFILAEKQTVTGVLFDAIKQLPAEHLPEKKLFRHWFALVLRIEQSHRLLNDTLAHTVRLLDRQGIHPILLKGQGVALRYPIPTHRVCGDLDLYVGKQAYGGACRALRESGLVQADEKENKKHLHTQTAEGVVIELHRMAALIHIPWEKHILQAWIGRQLADKASWRIWMPDGKTTVFLPSTTFDVFFLFYHLFYHFLSKGVGLRQLCDWMFALQQWNPTSSDQACMKHILRKCSLLRAWKIFMCIAVDYLGLSPEQAFLYDPASRPYASHIMQRILAEGNFGFFGEKAKAPQQRLQRKLFNFSRISRQMFAIFKVAPLHVCSFYLSYVLRALKRLLK